MSRRRCVRRMWAIYVAGLGMELWSGLNRQEIAPEDMSCAAMCVSAVWVADGVAHGAQHRGVRASSYADKSA